jgi:DNA-directed RNA polymerase specialized sigma24 family protein
LDADPAGRNSPDEIEKWELELIADFARRVERFDPGALEADLGLRWLLLRRRRPDLPRSRHYLTRFLENKLRTWRQKRWQQNKKLLPLDPWSAEEGFSPGDFAAPPDDTEGQQRAAALEQFREKLTPKLRRLFDLRAERKISQLAAARRLRRHPNTVRAWLKQIYDLLAAEGEPLSDLLPRLTTGRRSVRQRYSQVTLPASLLDRLISLRLSGIQWRMFFKILMNTSHRKQRLVPFTWQALARNLAVDRSHLSRAGGSLVRQRLVVVDGGKIGVNRHLRLRN